MKWWLALGLLLIWSGAVAQGADAPLAGAPGGTSAFVGDPETQRPRNTFGPPLISFFLPGFDQWWEGQYGYAVGYTGLAIGGGVFAAYNRSKLEDERLYEGYGDLPDAEKENRSAHGDRERKVVLGGQLQMAAGSFSAYHSFRTAVRSQQAVGNYEFLKTEESPADVLMAPFRFGFLSRATTYVPLGVIALYHGLIMNSDFDQSKEFKRDPLMPSDSLFAGGISYNAGTHEEALFRGWLMPVMREWTGSDWMSNAGAAGLFALAHLPSNPQPVLQALLGYHLGYVTQRNQWSIAESVFIHTWWDVFALLTQYQVKKRVPGSAPAVLWLPKMQWHF